MTFQTSDFDYHLPPEYIAQSPATPRESAKLMYVDRKNKTISHQHVLNLPTFFQSGDVVVINNTKVFHARLHGHISQQSPPIELFLIRPIDDSQWIVLGKPGKKLSIGTIVTIAEDFQAHVIAIQDDGTRIVTFHLPPEEVILKANIYGEIPTPPYIKKVPTEEEYQTSYAKIVGSVAAPTAGFHLTPSIRKELLDKGVQIVEITLHVGLGTFMPIKSDTLETHTMHSEWVHVDENASNIIRQAKQEHRRVIAIGTTTVRTLEGVANLHNGDVMPYKGNVNIFITPGFHFQVIDGMLTNFHLPKSTLVVLVSAFAGKEFILHAYEEAVKQNYRFYSFGDAMLIL